MKTLFIIFGFCLFSPSISSEESKYYWAPAVIYLDGVGPVYGIGGGQRRIFGSSAQVLAYKSFGKVDLFGLGLIDLPLWKKKLSMDLSLGELKSAEFETSYAREFNEGHVVRQEIKGSGFLFGLKYKFTENFRLKISRAHTVVKFVDYKTKDEKTIPFYKANLHDVDTTMNSLGLEWDVIEEKLSLSWSTVDLGGRLGQSDLRMTSLGLKGHLRLSSIFTLAYTTQLTRTTVTKEAPTSGIDGKCSSITDASLKTECEKLESDLNNYVKESNKHGTAMPLGGSKGLRSYRELRFKAANTALTGLELRWELPWKLSSQLIAFAELGHASDKFSTLYAHSRYSTGLGGRFFFNNTPVRLEAATGNEGQTVFLTAGHAW